MKGEIIINDEELRDLLLENCVNDNGDLVISNIDLSEFKGNVILDGWTVGGSGFVDLSFWEVKGNLYQRCQKVNGDLYQSYQSAKNIYQGFQTAKNIYQSYQNVRAKKLKEISLDELAKMGYKLKEKTMKKKIRDLTSPHILTQAEHDCLRAVIKPYKVEYIHKLEIGSGRSQFIEIVLKPTIYCDSNPTFSMPFFKSNSMYKGMEVYRNYTIEELELDKEWKE
mgnify:CR=1 FL=1